MQRLKLPFVVDRKSRQSLVAQVHEGLKGAILGGFYKVGDILPSREALAAALGVSVRVTREALAALAEDGLANPRQRIGTVVLGGGARIQRGRVLFVWMAYDESTYFATRFVGELRKRLMSAGYAFTVLTVPARSEKDGVDLSAFDGLAEGSADLVVVFSSPEAVRSRLDEIGMPYVTIGGKRRPGRNLVCHFRYNLGPSISELARRCRELGVRTVLQAGCVTTDPDAETALRKEGVSVETRQVSPPSVYHALDEQVRAAQRAFLAMFPNCHASLPDVVFFQDDYVAYGGLQAFAYAGVVIPRDVRVVTVSNKGAAPIANVTLAQIEFDFVAFGGTVAELILGFLKGERVPRMVPLTATFVPGESLSSVSDGLPSK